MKSKIKILSITIQESVEEYSDTDFLGEYSRRNLEWDINRKIGRFVHAEIVKDQIIEALKDRIQDRLEKSDENDADFIAWEKRQHTRIEKIENSLPENYIEYNSCEYFHPYAGGEKPGSPEYKKYAFQDYDRMEKLSSGDWQFLYINAEAKISINGVTQKIRSGGIGGVESDAGKEYLESIYEDEISALKEILIKLGIGKRAVSYAVNTWRKGNK